MNVINRLIALLILAVFPLSAYAVKSAESTSISVLPSVYVFKAVDSGSQSSSVEIAVKNISALVLNIGALSLSGDHANQYEITTDACSNSAVAAAGECLVNVRYSPNSRGHKQALLNIPSDSADTPILQAFLTSREDKYNESSRRLPPVLYNVTIPETMNAGQTYTLEWSILGYHGDYSSLLVMFDCTGEAEGTCGDSYGDASRFFSSGATAPSSTVSAPWSNGSISAKEFEFTTQFTPSFAQETDIVVRFYRKNTADKDAGKGSLSLVVPGNLAQDYYDKEGRRIKKKILP